MIKMRHREACSLAVGSTLLGETEVEAANMTCMEYLRSRWKPALAGATFGAVVGYLQPLFLSVGIGEDIKTQQLLLAGEMSIAFAILILLLMNYLDFRRRVRAQVLKKIQRERGRSPGGRSRTNAGSKQGNKASSGRS